MVNAIHSKLAGIQTKRLMLRNRESVDLYSTFWEIYGFVIIF